MNRLLASFPVDNLHKAQGRLSADHGEAVDEEGERAVDTNIGSVLEIRLTLPCDSSSDDAFEQRLTVEPQIHRGATKARRVQRIHPPEESIMVLLECALLLRAIRGERGP